MPSKKTPTPMETPGFGLRIAISIMVVFGWVAFMIIWFLFGAGGLSVYENLAVVLVSILVGVAILAAAWVSWGIKYGYKYGKKWDKNYKDDQCTGMGRMNSGGSGGAFYFLGFVAALIYFVTTAPTFWDAVLGFFKAVLWPAFLVYGSMVALGL